MSTIHKRSLAHHFAAYAACAGAVALVFLFAQQSVVANPNSTTTTEVVPGSGSPGWDWDNISGCDSWYPEAISAEVVSPITITTVSNLRKLHDCYADENCTIIDPLQVEFDTRYSKVHSWSVSGGITVGAEATVQSGLLSRVIVKGRVNVSGEVSVEGARSGQETHEFGKKWCYPIPSCLGIEVCEYYDDYESTASQSIGILHTSVIHNDDGTISEGDPCLYIFETLKAKGDGDTRRIARYDHFAPCSDDCEDPRDSSNRFELHTESELPVDPEGLKIEECEDAGISPAEHWHNRPASP